jgi:hypothetical protein
MSHRGWGAYQHSRATLVGWAQPHSETDDANKRQVATSSWMSVLRLGGRAAWFLGLRRLDKEAHAAGR